MEVPVADVVTGQEKRKVVPASPEEVKRARELLGLSQKHFAWFLGMSLQTIKSWEHGRRTPEVVVSKIIRLIIMRPEFAGQFLDKRLVG